MNVPDGMGGVHKKKTLFASFYENIAIALSILSRHLPLSLVTCPFLKSGVAALNPTHRFLGIPYLKTMIHSVARVIMVKIKAEMLATKNRLGGRWLGLQIDLWTDAHQTAYACLAETWCDMVACCRRFVVLASTAFPAASKTDRNLKLWGKTVLSRFGLSFDDCILFTADGGERTFMANELDCPWIVCVCHNAQRCVVKALQLESDVGDRSDNLNPNVWLCRIRNFLSLIKNSPLQSKRLLDIQKAENRPVIRPRLDVVTRWSSSDNMVGNFRELKQDTNCLIAVNRADFREHDIIPADYVIAARMNGVLSPMTEFVRTLEGHRYCTLNKVLPMIKNVEGILDVRTFDVPADPALEDDDDDVPPLVDANEDDGGYVEEHVGEMGGFFPNMVATLCTEFKHRFTLRPDDKDRAQFSCEVPELLMLATLADPEKSLRKYADLTARVWKLTQRKNWIDVEVKLLEHAWTQLQNLLKKQYDYALAFEPELALKLRQLESSKKRKSSVGGGGARKLVHHKKRRLDDDSDDETPPLIDDKDDDDDDDDVDDLPAAVKAEFAFVRQLRQSKIKLPEQNKKDKQDKLLAFWAGHQEKCPLFFRLVCKILAGTAAEANVERVFSIMKHIVGPGRENLGVDIRESITFATLNLHEVPRGELADDVRADLHPDEHGEALELQTRAEGTNTGNSGNFVFATNQRRLNVPAWFAGKGFNDGDFLIEGAGGPVSSEDNESLIFP